MAKLSLREFLSRAEHSNGKIDDSVLQYIVDNPEKILIIFDGLDEFKCRESCIKDEKDFSGFNDVTDEIPVSALYIKLLQNKLLPGARIITTTRPNAVDNVETLQFDRIVEILGFNADRIHLHVENICDDLKKATTMWQHIQTNLNLLYLCYIPATCIIVCDLLEFCLDNNLTLPTTLTEVYKGVLRMFIFEHHPEIEYKIDRSAHDFASDNFSESVEHSLDKLGLLARNGIEKRRLFFEEKEVKGLEDCGLLHCMPSKEVMWYGYVARPQYCFIHLSLQEFLAAREIAKMRPSELNHFIRKKAKDADWHLVIQFVAGLLKGQDAQVLESKMIFARILLQSMDNPRPNKKVALLMIKCLCELNDELEVEEAASELIRSNSQCRIDLSGIDIKPVDCTAIVSLLKHLGTHLTSLRLFNNSAFGDSGCTELAKLIEEGGGPEELDIAGCSITHQDSFPSDCRKGVWEGGKKS
ncbi:hypothetical protein QZH41_002419 [Actinostola sp. cb2023]|nr:hypothetical protein QZH41_002419 [Actinostola sp. cb2023]